MDRPLPSRAAISYVPAMIRDDADAIDAALRDALVASLGLSPERVATFDDTTPLFGALSELDSMAVAGLLTEVEDRLGFVIEDDEVTAEMLESFGALRAFVTAKAVV